MKLKDLKSQLKKLTQKLLKFDRKKAMVGLAILILILVLYLFKGLFIAAMVNNKPVWRLTLIREMEKQGGQKTLDSLITQNLIKQEGNKQKVNIPASEIDATIKQIEDSVTQQGQKLDDLLKAQGLTRTELREQIRIQKIAEKILSKDVKVTDQEIKDYYDKNKSAFPEGKTLDDVKGDIQKQLEQQKLSTKIQTWIEELRTKAKINYFVKF